MTEKELRLEGEVYEDERTGEIIPITEPLNAPKVQSNTLATSLDLTKVGTLVLNEKAEAVLAEPLEPKDVQIRPDGLVYLPWTWFAERLNRAFGRLAWGLVPQAGPQTKDMGNMILVVWGHWLVVRGVPVGFEMGETAYRPDNHTMSFGDAAAGAKSNSLARNCKMLGMSLELWSQEWIEDWKKQYAERVKNPKGGRPEYIWQKKKTNGLQKSPENVKVGEPVVATPEKTEEVKATTEEKMWSLEQLKQFKVLEQLAEDSGKTKKDVAIFLGKLDKSGAYRFHEIVQRLQEGE
jgi:hypothetical protein